MVQPGRALIRRFAHRLAALTLLLSCAAPLPAVAQDALREIAVPGFPRYTVELIVFAYDESAWSGGEIFVPDVPPEYAAADGEHGNVPVFSDRPEDLLPPESGAGRDAAASGDDEAEGELPALANAGEENEITGFDGDLRDVPLRARIELDLLPPEAWTLDNVYDALDRIGAYHPLMHMAWTQTTPPHEQAPAIRLRALGNPPPGLSGTVTLYQGRFVHLGLDLTLDAAAAEALESGAYDSSRSATDRAIAGSGLPPGTGGSIRDGAVPAYGDATFGAPALPVRYHLSEVRIMHDGTVRYYDHPRFGVIAKLTAVKPPGGEARDPSTP
ncbi:MAG TPA: CsiV family protein [Woeseiaceae bacterium]